MHKKLQRPLMLNNQFNGDNKNHLRGTNYESFSRNAQDYIHPTTTHGLVNSQQDVCSHSVESKCPGSNTNLGIYSTDTKTLSRAGELGMHEHLSSMVTTSCMFPEQHSSALTTQSVEMHNKIHSLKENGRHGNGEPTRSAPQSDLLALAVAAANIYENMSDGGSKPGSRVGTPVPLSFATSDAPVSSQQRSDNELQVVRVPNSMYGQPPDESLGCHTNVSLGQMFGAPASTVVSTGRLDHGGKELSVARKQQVNPALGPNPLPHQHQPTFVHQQLAPHQGPPPHAQWPNSISGQNHPGSVMMVHNSAKTSTSLAGGNNVGNTTPTYFAPMQPTLHQQPVPQQAAPKDEPKPKRRRGRPPKDQIPNALQMPTEVNGGSQHRTGLQQEGPKQGACSFQGGQFHPNTHQTHQFPPYMQAEHPQFHAFARAHGQSGVARLEAPRQEAIVQQNVPQVNQHQAHYQQHQQQILNQATTPSSRPGEQRREVDRSYFPQQAHLHQQRAQMPPLIPNMNMPMPGMNSQDQLAYRAMLSTYEQYSSQGIIPSPAFLANSQQQQMRDLNKMDTQKTLNQTSKMPSVTATTTTHTMPSTSTGMSSAAYHSSPNSAINHMQQQYFHHGPMPMAMHMRQMQTAQQLRPQHQQGHQHSPMQNSACTPHQLGSESFRLNYPYATPMTTPGTSTIRAMLEQHPHPQSYRVSAPVHKDVQSTAGPSTSSTDQLRRKRKYTSSVEREKKTRASASKDITFRQHVENHIQEATAQCIQSIPVNQPPSDHPTTIASSQASHAVQTASTPCPPALKQMTVAQQQEFVKTTTGSTTLSPNVPKSTAYLSVMRTDVPPVLAVQSAVPNVMATTASSMIETTMCTSIVNTTVAGSRTTCSSVTTQHKNDPAGLQHGRHGEEGDPSASQLLQTPTQKQTELQVYRQMLPKLEPQQELPATVSKSPTVPESNRLQDNNVENEDEKRGVIGTSETKLTENIASVPPSTQSTGHVSTLSNVPEDTDKNKDRESSIIHGCEQQVPLNKRDTHACYLCRECFKEAKDIKHHINRAHWHWYNEPYVCKECLVIGKNWYDFQQHVYQVHRRAPPHQFIPKRILQIMYAMLIIPPGQDVPQLSACHMGKGTLTPIMATSVEKEDCEKDSDSEIGSKVCTDIKDAPKPSSPVFSTPPPLKELPKLQLLSSVEPAVLDKIKKAMDTREVIQTTPCIPSQGTRDTTTPSPNSQPQSSQTGNANTVSADVAASSPVESAPGSRRSSQENTKTAIEIRRRIEEVKDKPLDNSPEAQLAKKIRKSIMSKLGSKISSDSDESGHSPKNPAVDIVDQRNICDGENLAKDEKQISNDQGSSIPMEAEQLFAEFKTKLWVAITIKLSCETAELKDKVNSYCESFNWDNEANRKKLRVLLEGAPLPFEKTPEMSSKESDDNNIIIKLANRIIDINKDEHDLVIDNLCHESLKPVAGHPHQQKSINPDAVPQSSEKATVGEFIETTRDCPDKYPSYTEAIDAVIEQSRQFVSPTCKKAKASKKRNSTEQKKAEKKVTALNAPVDACAHLSTHVEDAVKDDRLHNPPTPKLPDIPIVENEEQVEDGLIKPDEGGKTITEHTEKEPSKNETTGRRPTKTVKRRRKILRTNNPLSSLLKNRKTMTPRVVLKSPSRKRPVKANFTLSKTNPANKRTVLRKKALKKVKNDAKKNILKHVFKKQEGSKRIKHHKIYERLLTRKPSDETEENPDSPQSENPLKSIFQKYGVDMDNPVRVKWKDSGLYEDAEKENNASKEVDDSTSICSVDSLVYFPEYQTEYEEGIPNSFEDVNLGTPVEAPKVTGLSGQDIVSDNVFSGGLEVSVSEVEVSTEGEKDLVTTMSSAKHTSAPPPNKSIPVVVLKRLTQRHIDKFSGGSETEDDEASNVSSKQTFPKSRIEKMKCKEAGDYNASETLSPLSGNSIDDSEFEDVEFVIELENRPNDLDLDSEYISDSPLPFDYDVGANVIIGGENHDSRKVDPVELEKHAAYFCSICNFSNTQEKCVKSHMTRYHGKGRLAHKIIKKLWVRWQCLICDFLTSERENVENHLKDSHITLEPLMECSLCSKKENTINEIHDHILMNHGDVSTAMKIVKKAEKVEKYILQFASLCDRKSVAKERYDFAVKEISKMSRNKYIKEHIDIQEEEFECLFCPFSVPSEYFIQLHVRQHMKLQKQLSDTGQLDDNLRALIGACYDAQHTLPLTKDSKLKDIRSSLDLLRLPKTTLVALFGDSVVDESTTTERKETQIDNIFGGVVPVTNSSHADLSVIPEDGFGSASCGETAGYPSHEGRIKLEPEEDDVSLRRRQIDQYQDSDSNTLKCDLQGDNTSPGISVCEQLAPLGPRRLLSDDTDYNRQTVECPDADESPRVMSPDVRQPQTPEINIIDPSEDSLGNNETSVVDICVLNTMSGCEHKDDKRDGTETQDAQISMSVKVDISQNIGAPLENASSVPNQAQTANNDDVPSKGCADEVCTIAAIPVDIKGENRDNRYEEDTSSTEKREENSTSESKEESSPVENKENDFCANREAGNKTVKTETETALKTSIEPTTSSNGNDPKIRKSLTAVDELETVNETPSSSNKPFSEVQIAPTSTTEEGPSFPEKRKDDEMTSFFDEKLVDNTPLEAPKGNGANTPEKKIAEKLNSANEGMLPLEEENHAHSQSIMELEKSESKRHSTPKEVSKNAISDREVKKNRKDTHRREHRNDKDEKRSKSSHHSAHGIGGKPVSSSTARKLPSINLHTVPKIILRPCDVKEKSSTANKDFPRRSVEQIVERNSSKRKLETTSTRDLFPISNKHKSRHEGHLKDRDGKSARKRESEKNIASNSTDKGKTRTLPEAKMPNNPPIEKKVKLDFSDALQKFKQVNNKLASKLTPATLQMRHKETTSTVSSVVNTPPCEGPESKTNDNARNVWDALKDMLS